MHEVMEAHEAHEHKGEPFTLRVAVTMSILAVLVAIATLLGHRSATEKVVSQALASDQWSFYQAKNIRLREMQGVADMLATVAPIDKEKAEALREKYLKEVERYDKEKDAISEKAKELEKERDVFGRKEDRFDASEVILEIGLIICSLTLLTQKKIFWFSGMVLGVIGFFVTVSGFLIH